MDLLKFLITLPMRVVRGIALFFDALGLLLAPLFGSVSWSPPNWVFELGAAVRRYPRQYAGGAVGTVVGLLLLWSGVQWYLHRPHPPEPERITITAVTPDITDYEQPDGTPAVLVHPLDVKFSASAAPIEKVGKIVTAGITMDPALKGKWSWVDDRTLRFIPAVDWPIGKHIVVQFDNAQMFAPHVLMASDNCAFDIPNFAVTAGTAEFYQDPENPTAKKTIMQMSFNYPVDPAEFEKRIALVMKGPADSVVPLKFSITYDAAKLKAFIHSQPLDLPRDNNTVVLSLDAGVTSSRGGDPTSAQKQMSVGVPGLYSLSIGAVTPTLVDNDRYEPEQVLALTVSDAVRGSDLLNLVKAYVLPKRKAGVKQAADEPPYEWSDSDVSDDVLRHSQTLKLELVPTEKDYAELQSFKYHAEPGQRIFIRFANGLKSFGGYILGKPNTQLFTVPDYPKLLRFMANGSLLSLSGDKRVSVVSRNVPGMRLEVGRVLPDQLQHLVSFNNGTFAAPDFSSFGEDHIVERFVEQRAFPPSGPGQAHYEGVDLSPYLKEGKHGIFLLHLSTYDAAKAKKAADTASDNSDSSSDASSDDTSSDESNSDAQPADTRLIVVTDLGMLAKKAVDDSRDIFVQSIHTGQPVGGASVSIVALNGDTLYTADTSADGVVHFPTLKGLDREKKPVMYVVKKGDDLSFLPIDASDRKLDYSRFDIGGEANALTAGELSAYLFSDRGIYRPGDLFHVGLIVRTASWAQSPAGIPLQAEIVDPRGITVKRVPITVDNTGFGEISYTPPETAPTGTWTINLTIVRKDGSEETAIGSTTVSVKEFLPDSMKVDAGLSHHVTDGWVKPDQLKGLVDVHNLFGTPASSRRVQATLTLNPTFPAFHNWADFQFFDLRHAKDGYTTQLQDGHTDDQGHAEFDLDLKKYADATYRLDFLVKAYEAEGGRNVAATAQTLVSSNAWLVGYKAVDDLTYIQRSSPRSVRLVAIDPETKAIELKGLTAQLIERRYVSVLTKQQSGVYKYESKLKEVPLESKPLTIPAGGLDYALPTDKPGDYALLIRSGNLNVNRIEYSVTGAANLSRSLDRNAELEVKLSKQDYAPGEPVEISLRAPYAGSGLITIERDKVYAHAWFTARTTNSVQHIAVPAGFEGNGYINVQYIRDPGSNEIFMSPLSYGVAPFTVDVDARRNKLKIDAPDLVKPGETVTFKLTAGRPTRAVLFAVDEGILQVARYKLGDPLKFFFRKRMLEVGTSQILDLILPDFKTLMSIAAPGGDNGDAIGRQLNPFKRHRDKPVVYWSGIVDVNGEKDITYTVPDYFHGKLHVMAVSVSPDLIGTAENATTVRGDFVLTPDAPTTLAPGDEAEVGVGVSNNIQGAGSKPMPVAVTLKVGPQFQLLGPPTQTLSLASMHEGALTFRVRATGVLGSGALTFAASSAGKSSMQRIDVSIRPAATFRTEVQIASLGAGSRFAVGNLRHMVDAYAVRNASISTVPLVLSEGLTRWLVNYDNYCSEQIVSASMPRLIASKWSAVPVFSRALTPQLAGAAQGDALAAQIEALRSRQNEQGGFGLWAATPDSVPFVSDYAMHFLLEARDRGASVPKDVIDSGNQYLQTLAADDSIDTPDGLRARAYAVYLLTRQGNITTNALASVQKRLGELFPKQWKNDLAAGWLAASYKLMKQDNEANLLIAPLQRQLETSKGNGSFEYEDYDDPLIQDSTVLYLLAKHFPDRAKTLSPRALDNIARPLENNEFNTLSAAMTMLALDVYSSTNAASVEKLGIEEIDANGKARPIASLQNKLLQDGTWSGQAKALRFTNGSNLPAWAVVDQAGYDRDVPFQAIKNGLEIVRDYTDAKGNELSQVALGQEIDVHVKIRATAGKGIGDVVIVDLLPGGFDPITQLPPEPAPDAAEGTDSSSPPPGPTIRLGTSTWTPVSTDVREDRVVIYGSASPDVQEFIYRIKASAAGKFIVPPAYGESMYDRRIQARSPGGAYITVVHAP